MNFSVKLSNIREAPTCHFVVYMQWKYTHLTWCSVLSWLTEKKNIHVLIKRKPRDCEKHQGRKYKWGKEKVQQENAEGDSREDKCKMTQTNSKSQWQCWASNTLKEEKEPILKDHKLSSSWDCANVCVLCEYVCVYVVEMVNE